MRMQKINLQNRKIGRNKRGKDVWAQQREQCIVYTCVYEQNATSVFPVWFVFSDPTTISSNLQSCARWSMATADDTTRHDLYVPLCFI